MGDLDNRITKEIKEAMDKEMSESAMDINVDTRDGFVTLSGMADTLAEKRAAEEIATKIQHIKGIENDITISTDGTITDKEIEMEVINKLRGSRSEEDLSAVQAHVESGIVNLKGSVKTLRGEKRAINEAEKAFGAKDIVSNLKIISAGKVDDPSIENSFVRELVRAGISTPDIFTEVKNSIISISGHVDSRKDMEAAVEIAESIEGVSKVRNLLRVR